MDIAGYGHYNVSSNYEPLTGLKGRTRLSDEEDHNYCGGHG